MSGLKVIQKRYLGDGVYAECDGMGLILTTENGESIQNEIIIEDYVLEKLKALIEEL